MMNEDQLATALGIIVAEFSQKAAYYDEIVIILNTMLSELGGQAACGRDGRYWYVWDKGGDRMLYSLQEHAIRAIVKLLCEG
jgi:hypothetical protein